jgi:hypothetical protein
LTLQALDMKRRKQETYGGKLKEWTDSLLYFANPFGVVAASKAQGQPKGSTYLGLRRV